MSDTENNRQTDFQGDARISLVLRAVTTSWIAIITAAAADFFLTPYILRRLGDEAFGVLILVVNLVGYYGLVDGGVRSSILRYVSRHKALGNQEGVNEVVATGFYYYLCVCTLVVLATYLSVGWISRFFSIPTEILGGFKALFLLAGVVQGLTLPLLVFAGSLEAVGRIDQVNTISVACQAIRMICVISVLRAGGGLFGVGAATILSQFLAYSIQIPLAIRAHPGLSLRPGCVRKSVFRDILQYGSISLTVGIAERMRGNLYPVVIAKLLTSAAVTFFSLPMKMIAFPMQGIATMTGIVNPFSSYLEARNDFAKLRQLILLSVQGAFLFLAPLAVFLFVFGRELLTLWVGRQYASAYVILVLVTLGMGTAATQCCIQSMLFGIGRHKQLIWYRLGEGLTIALVGSAMLRIWGLEGFALVTAVTLLLTSLVLVPRHLCKILNLSLRHYLIEGCLKPCVLSLPVAAVFVLSHSLTVFQSWSSLVVAFLIGSSTYVLTLLFVTRQCSHSAFGWLSLGVLQLLEQKFRKVPYPREIIELEKSLL